MGRKDIPIFAGEFRDSVESNETRPDNVECQTDLAVTRSPPPLDGSTSFCIRFLSISRGNFSIRAMLFACFTPNSILQDEYSP